MDPSVRDNRLYQTSSTTVLQRNSNPVEMDNSCIDLVHKG